MSRDTSTTAELRRDLVAAALLLATVTVAAFVVVMTLN
jgi:hypothetical protein